VSCLPGNLKIELLEYGSVIELEFPSRIPLLFALCGII